MLFRSRVGAVVAVMGGSMVTTSAEQSLCTTAVVSLGTTLVTSDRSATDAAPMTALQSSVPWPAAGAAGMEVKSTVAVGDVRAAARVRPATTRSDGGSGSGRSPGASDAAAGAAGTEGEAGAFVVAAGGGTDATPAVAGP